MSEPAKQPTPARAIRRFLSKVGVAGLLFFLIKGLLWLLLPAALVAWRALTT